MKLRFILTIFAVTFFVCKGAHGQTSMSMPPDVSVAELKAQIERMEHMLKAQQGQIDKLKQVIEEKVEIASPSARNDMDNKASVAVKEEQIEEVVDKYLAKEETKEKFAKLGLSPNVKMGYKKGFYLETLDEKFKLNMSGRIQFRYDYTDKDEGQDASSFFIRRARLTWAGHTFSPNIKYKLEADFGRGKDFHMLDYYFDMTHIPALNLQFGQYKAPFNRQRITSSGSLQFVDRSIANDEFNLDRQIGVMLHSKQLLDKKFEYGVGIFNGNGLNQKGNTDNEHLYVGRVAFNPFGDFGYSEGDLDYSEKLLATIGGGFGYSSKGASDDVDRTQFVAEGGLKYRGFSLHTEGYFRDMDFDSSADEEDTGFFVQGGYFVIPKKLELAARYSMIDFDNDALSSGDTEEKKEYTGGINYFFEGHRSKIQANLVKLEDETFKGKDKNDYVLKLMYQIYF